MRSPSRRAGDQFLEVNTRRRPIVTDNLEANVPTAPRESGETCDELRDATTSKKRSDVQNRRWRGVSGSEGISGHLGDTGVHHVNGRRIDAEPLVISRFENSEIVSTRSRAARGQTCERPAPQPLSCREPFRMGRKRDVVDGHHNRRRRQTEERYSPVRTGRRRLRVEPVRGARSAPTRFHVRAAIAVDARPARTMAVSTRSGAHRTKSWAAASGSVSQASRIPAR